MLLSKVVVSSRILSPAGRFPVREYEKPQDGFSRFMYCIQYRTPENTNGRADSAQAPENPYDYE